jgi:hypothetical protein
MLAIKDVDRHFVKTTKIRSRRIERDVGKREWWYETVDVGGLSDNVFTRQVCPALPQRLL